MSWSPRPGFRREILEQLDGSAGSFEFPVLDNPLLPTVSSRLVAFRSDADWLITFQTVTWEPPNGLVIGLLYAYGGEVSRPGVVDSMNPLAPVGGGTFNGPDGRPDLDPHDCEVDVRGVRRTLRLSRDDYVGAGVEPDGVEPSPLVVLRYLAATEPDSLLWTDDEILAKAAPGRGLQRFRQLDRWDHPDIIGDEKPSSSGSLAGLASALAAGDPDRDG